MSDHETLTHLQSSWPGTEDYLQRVGQVTNDLMVLRELRERESYEASLTWLDRLGYDLSDVTAVPTGMQVLRFLYGRRIVVKAAMQLPVLQELQQELDAEETDRDVREDQTLELPSAEDAQLWAVPELQRKLIAWALETAQRHGFEKQLTVAQAVMLLNVVSMLEAEPGMSPEWAAESLRSVLSSGLFEKDENPQR
ncbi:hypothetical protein NHL51_01210 [Leucobacter sp. gxy201]|uniref:hypothetical protein n=1 Tax=Leucobacter sp. gxy201 TaxID=2957200 RepID=UPI003DA06D18